MAAERFPKRIFQAATRRVVTGVGILKTAALLALAGGTFSCGGSGPASASQWFAVAARNANITPVLAAVQSLRASSPSAAVVASADCGNLAPGEYLAAVPSRNQSEAQAAAGKMAGASVQECRVRPDSRLQLGVPVVDPSIASVPAGAVNWTDADRISTVHRLPGGGYLWLQRRYETDAQDPREGRRESVLHFKSNPAQAQVVEQDCSGAQYASQAVWLALSCAREAVDNQWLHSTMIYRVGAPGARKTYTHCRDPKFESDTEVSCQVESLTNQGALRLAPRRYRLN